MKLTLTAICVLLLCFPLSSQADLFDLGGRTIEIPAPAGYVRVADDMPELKRLADQLTDSLNDTLAFYIPESSALSARAGKLPSLDRYLVAKVSKKLRTATVGMGDFAEIRSKTMARLQQTIKELESKMPGQLEQIMKNVKREYDVDADLGGLRMIPLEFHRAFPDEFAYSMLISYGAGGETKSLRPATVTVTNVAGRVIFLYAYGPPDELAWTRESSADWQTTIARLNPSAPRNRWYGMDWEQVGWTALGGALIGGFGALLADFLRRRKKT